MNCTLEWSIACFELLVVAYFLRWKLIPFPYRQTDINDMHKKHYTDNNTYAHINSVKIVIFLLTYPQSYIMLKIKLN